MIEANTILNNLHIDSEPEELELMTQLVQQARAEIRNQVSFGTTDEDLQEVDSDAHNKAIETLASAYYYDRNLSAGYSKGLLITLNQLKTKYSYAKGV